MSEALARLDAFIATWRGRLCAGSAEVRITARPLEHPPGLHSACADALVTSLGYQPIGGNWELLDAEAEQDGARSARAALVEAFARHMVFAHEPWLGEADALAMAEDFLACFDARTRQIVTNRMYSAGTRSLLRVSNGPSSPSTTPPSRCCSPPPRTNEKGRSVAGAPSSVSRLSSS